MRRQVLSLVFTIFILLGASFQSTTGQECPVNQELVECIDFCNTFEPCIPMDPPSCIPGCDCVPGYSRNIDGDCAPHQFCQKIPENHICPNSRLCDALCKRRAFVSGRCEGPKKLNCICCNHPSTAESYASFQDMVFPSISPQDVLQSCGCPNAMECSSNCRRRGYKDGGCEGSFCRCTGPFTSPDVTSCPEESKCLQSCLSSGFKTGFCDGLKCQCLKSKPVCFYFEVFEEPTGEKCQSGPCHRRCKEQGYRYGLCQGDADQICGCFQKVESF